MRYHNGVRVKLEDHRTGLDRWAAALSGLCVLHCALGVALVAAAAPAAWLGGHALHAAGLVMVLPIALLALWRGRQRHGEAGPLLLGVAGLTLVAAGLAVGHGTAAEFLLAGTGAAVHACAHGWNLRTLARVRSLA